MFIVEQSGTLRDLRGIGRIEGHIKDDPRGYRFGEYDEYERGKEVYDEIINAMARNEFYRMPAE